MESVLWQMFGPLIPQQSHMNGGNLNQKAKDHRPACMQLQVPALMVFFCFVVGGTLIVCPSQVRMVLQSIGMGAGSGQLPLASLHHPDINMQLFLSTHDFMSQEGLLEAVAW